jgi:hypothetical protein
LSLSLDNLDIFADNELLACKVVQQRCLVYSGSSQPEEIMSKQTNSRKETASTVDSVVSKKPGGIPMLLGLLIIAVVIGGLVLLLSKPTAVENKSADSKASDSKSTEIEQPIRSANYKPRETIDDSGYASIFEIVEPWPVGTSLLDISKRFKGAAKRKIEALDRELAKPNTTEIDQIVNEFAKARFFNFDGEVDKAYECLVRVRKVMEKNPDIAETDLFTVIYYQGVTALRKGENENCIMCRGESSCILPIVPAAQHTNRAGSELAIKHFTEYLKQFPDDMEVKWLLNIAHMTLGEYPDKVNPDYLVPIEHYADNGHSIGKFRDIGEIVGVNRFNQAGGGIMEDFNNDGLLDVVVTSFDPTQVMGYFQNKGDGTFEDRTTAAGLTDQVGGLNCMQTDYNNDGWMDVFIVRGAWLTKEYAMRPTLLRNNGDGTMTDVTESAGMGEPVNSIAAAWADYDNDGWLDVLVCCERQYNRLYRNNSDGTFEEKSASAGLAGSGEFFAKGAAWIDYDNDGWQDLFINHLSAEGGQFFRNNKDGTFSRVTSEVGIRGPVLGFACWAWDYNNDGWLDIFATSYDRTLKDLAMDLSGRAHSSNSGRLYRNKGGKGFEDVSLDAGLAGCYATMGSNFGDLNNDGWLDMYLGTGEPNLSVLVPNRMFVSKQGSNFLDVTASSGTGNLQKGHGVAIGDWDCDGSNDIFIEMGGAVNGDKYHNIMFQNPGHPENSWLTIKLVGQKTNRAAIGARIKIVTKGPNPQTIHRLVSSGSSFGGNPLQQTIGLGTAEEIESLEISWPTSGTKQVFENVPLRTKLEITEFAESFREIPCQPIKFTEK